MKIAGIKKGMILSWVLSVLLILAVSCSETEDQKSSNVLVVGEISDFEALNPFGTTDAHARDIYNNIFLPLLDENPDLLTFSPRLAESYEFSDDRRKLIFHLRKDVYWSDGVRFTSRDVTATFRAQVNPAVAWPSQHLKKHIDSVVAVDKWTVVYYFNEVYPYQVMDARDGPILPAHFLEKIDPAELPRVPVEEIPSNGPFRVESWKKGQALTLVSYQDYYEEDKPYLDRVIFKVIPDQVTLITQLRSGEIDVMESIPPGEVADLEKNHPELRIFKFPTRAYGYIGWNAKNPLFKDIQVRRALTMAIDRQKIIDNVYYGYADECTSPFVPLIWAYNPNIEPIPFDPERAGKILADEGFSDSDGDGWLDRNGRKFEFELITNYGNQIRQDIQVMVQSMLKRVGIKVVPRALEWTVFLDRVKASSYDAMVNAWRVGTKADLAPIWSCEARKDGYNRVNYCNTTVDSLNEKACSLLDFEKARPLFYRAQKIIYREQPYTFTYQGVALNAISRRLKNVRPDVISMYHNLHEWRIPD